MHTNILWRAFLLVIFAITLFYSSIALYRYYVYISLSAIAHPSNMDWNVIKEMDNRYVIEAPYQFTVEGKTYGGKTVWNDDQYLNEYAAQEAIGDSKDVNWVVWYNPSNPEKSSLKKKMPAKECFYAIFLWGLFLYFLWLGYYVGTFRT